MVALAVMELVAPTVAALEEAVVANFQQAQELQRQLSLEIPVVPFVFRGFHIFVRVQPRITTKLALLTSTKEARCLLICKLV